MPAGFGEFGFEIAHRAFRCSGAGDEQKVTTRGDVVLLMAEDLPKPALGPVALGGRTDGRGRSDHTDPRTIPGDCGIVPAFPPNRKDPAINAPALLADGADVTLPAQVLLSAESHVNRVLEPTRGRRMTTVGQTTVRRLRPLRRRALMTLRPPFVAIRAR